MKRTKIGPGTELKLLLHRFGIKARTGCNCEKYRLTMDNRGCDWCDCNLELIVGWVVVEAKKRRLPAPKPLLRILIRSAIRRARKKMA